MSEQKIPTKEEILIQLKDAIEVQKLQTELQLLRTQLVLSRYDEVKYTMAFQDLTKTDQNEGKPDSQEVQDK